jgi:hypothetical protein
MNHAAQTATRSRFFASCVAHTARHTTHTRTTGMTRNGLRGSASHEPDERADNTTRSAPGKVALTQSTASGFLCDRAELPGCDLDPLSRRDVHSDLVAFVGSAMDNYRAAIRGAQIELMTSTRHGWGALSEFLFYAVTGPMIASVVKIIKDVPSWAKHVDDVQATLTNSSRSLRKSLQSEVEGRDPAVAGKVRFLQLVEDGIKPMQDTLVRTARTLTDDALSALAHAFERGEHSIDHYRSRIDHLLASYDAAHFESIGVEAIYRHGELRWIGRGKRRRLVMLEDNGLHHPAGSGGPLPRDLVGKVGSDGAPIVIDESMVPLAIQIYRDRTGREPLAMDPEEAIRLGGILAKIGSEVLTGILALGSEP